MTDHRPDDPHDGSPSAWLGYAACIIDPGNNLFCAIQTGQQSSLTDVGDPLFTWKPIGSSTFGQYCKFWFCENDGNYVDFYGL